ncbi:MAG: HupE/UreJ family protein [Acidobacteria bacterium]|nr:HupE/UreJ family protein [Acidobacteriota bacterium]
MMRRLCLLLAPLPLLAHMVSMSSSELRIHGTRGELELRLPMYEVVHIPSAERSVFENIHFSGGGGPARLVAKRCREYGGDASLVCTGSYEFPGAADQLEAEVTLFSITVPNHIHVLRAVNGDKSDQAVFDASFSKAVIAFRPPTTFQTLVTEFGAGLVRAAGLAQLLFLAALVLAARSRRELLFLTLAFVAAELAVAVVMPYLAWEPAPRFVEAASALTIAYLAVEILLLPAAGKRWIVVAALGLFHGFYFVVFLRTSGYHAGFFLPGVVVAEVAAIAVLGVAFQWLERYAAVLRPVRLSAAALLVIGLAWFAVRLRS